MDTSLSIEELYEKIAWPLYKKYKIESQNEDEKKVIDNLDNGKLPFNKLLFLQTEYLHCYDVFKKGVSDDSVFEGLDMTSEMRTSLKSHIRRRLTPQPIKFRADVEVQ